MINVLTNSSIIAEIKSCGRLAIPLAAAQVTDSATGFLDIMMMGLLGSETVAAGGLGAISFNYLLWICSSIASAVSPLAAQAYGAGNTQAVRRVLQQGLWLTAVLGIPITLLLWNGEKILLYFGQDASTAALAKTYLHAIAWGFFPALGFSVLKGFVSALSKPRPVMIIVLLGIFLNIGGNYVLMFGKLGLPALGLAGVGLASTITYWSMFTALLLYILAQKHFAVYKLCCNAQFNRQIFGELLQVGLPIGGLMAVEAGISAIGTFLAGQLSTTSLAAHQIAYQTAGIITYQVASGISIATTIRVGQLMGQSDVQGSRRAGFVGIGLAGLCMSVFSLAFWLVPEQIVSLYLDVTQPANTDVATLAKTLLGLAALFQMIDGAQVTAAGALRGFKDTQVPMWIGFLAHWCIGLPVSYVLGMQLELGVVGLWLGVAVGLTIAACVLIWRFNTTSSQAVNQSRHILKSC